MDKLHKLIEEDRNVLTALSQIMYTNQWDGWQNIDRILADEKLSSLVAKNIYKDSKETKTYKILKDLYGNILTQSEKDIKEIFPKSVRWAYQKAIVNTLRVVGEAFLKETNIILESRGETNEEHIKR